MTSSTPSLGVDDVTGWSPAAATVVPGCCSTDRDEVYTDVLVFIECYNAFCVWRGVTTTGDVSSVHPTMSVVVNFVGFVSPWAYFGAL